MGNASVKIDAPFAVAGFKLRGTESLEAGLALFSPGVLVVHSQTSSPIKMCHGSGGKNERVGKRANTFQESSCQARASLNVP